MTNENNLSSGDKELLKAAQTGEGTIELTPKMMEELANSIEHRLNHIQSTYPALVAKCPVETRLAITAQVFQAIWDHMQEGGTFRYLIYERLGFGPEAYLPLYEAGGMNISNAIFDLREKEKTNGPAAPDNDSA